MCGECFDGGGFGCFDGSTYYCSIAQLINNQCF
jgi:hypothetical protein